MKREIKFRRVFVTDTDESFSHFGIWGVDITWASFISPPQNNKCHYVADQQYTGLKDKNGKEIYEGDILQFSNKWEWWRSKFGGGMLASEKDYNEVLTDHVKYPYERRVVEIPMDYSWLLSSEIQIYWEVVGNIFQNPELLK